MRTLQLVSTITAVAASFAVTSCGGSGIPAGAAGEAVRPKETSAATALGEAPAEGTDCTSISSTPKPFLADWKADQRAQLDVAMQKGVAVISYDCKGIRLLPDCNLKGEYAFAKIEKQRETMELTSNDDLSSTIPLSALSVSAELKRGSSLQLAYVMVGQRGTTLLEAPKSELVGRCDGATHFVRAAWIGAFRFGTATEGAVGGGAKIFGAGAEASSASRKKIQNEAGSPESCEKGGADGPPDGCGAMVRLELAPVVEKVAEKITGPGDASSGDAAAAPTEPKQAENPCSAGFVLSNGKCTKKTAAAAYLCDPKNVTECVEQCNAGSKESCYNAALVQLRPDVNADSRAGHEAAEKFYEKGCGLSHLKSCSGQASILANSGVGTSRAKAKELFKRACEGGDKNACASLANAADFGTLEVDRLKFQPDLLEAAMYMKKACNLGSSYGCASLAKRYITGKGVAQNPAEGIKALTKACDFADSYSCWELGNIHRKGEGTPKDAVKAESAYKLGCDKYKGSLSCTELGRMYRAGDGVPKALDKAKGYLEKACPNPKFVGEACTLLGQMHEKGEGVPKDELVAMELYTRACPGDSGWYTGCFFAASLFDKGGASIKKDPAKAAPLFARACYIPAAKAASPSTHDLAQDKQACARASDLLPKQDKEKAKDFFGRQCRSSADIKMCAQFKALGGTPPAPPGTKPATPPAPPPPATPAAAKPATPPPPAGPVKPASVPVPTAPKPASVPPPKP